MNAQEWKQLISAYADDAVTPQEKIEAEKLLRERPECQAYLKELRAISSSLHILKDQPLSPDAESQILAHVKKESKMNTISWKSVSAVMATVLVAFLALQQYAQHSIQGRVRDSAGEYAASPASHPMQIAMEKTTYYRGGVPVVPEYRNSVNGMPAVRAYDAATPMPVRVPAPMEAMKKENMQLAALSGTAMPLNARMANLKDKYAPVVRGQMAMAAAPVSAVSYGYNSAIIGNAGGARSDQFALQKQAGQMPQIPMYSPQREMAQPMMAQNMMVQDVLPVQDYPGASMPVNSEEYTQRADNQFLDATTSPLSTFSMDVDTASYSNVRRFLTQNQMPPVDAVRLEEMINYFSYNYPKPTGNDPFSITTNIAVCPWNSAHQLVQIGLKGKVPEAAHVPASNLVFLIDVSGSMNQPDKLPLIKEGLKMMVSQLRPQDRVSLVVYAGNAGLVLDSTPGDQKQWIDNAIDSLQAGGSTAGGEGILLAYEIAKRNFINGGNNRVILSTDGDFNVGVTNTDELVRMMEEERRAGIFLTLLGVGQDNLKDNRMQQLADKGNGNYYYLDSLREAEKVLVDELGSTIYTIAKDVKVQVEFNPAVVTSYRLIGYEKRVMAKEDFNNDQKDAGEIGAGHTVTALYEIVPVGAEENGSTDPLKYQKIWKWPFAGGDVMTIKLRYKEPQEGQSKLITRTLKKTDVKDEPTGDFAWAASVAEFGMLLRDSEFKGDSSYEEVLQMAGSNMGADTYGLRSEFINLVQQARQLSPYQNNTNGRMQFKQ